MRFSLVLLLLILLFRFYDLEVRPPHHDEAVNGWFVDGMRTKGFYQYDPQNYHGPFYFYLLALCESIFGRSLFVLRSVPVVLGMAFTFVPFLFIRWLGSRAAWMGAFFLAVSPANVFYSRYSIHETGFALACGFFVWLWIEIRESGMTINRMVGLGLTLGLMASMKENFVILCGTLLIADLLITWTPRFLPTLMKPDSWSLPKQNVGYWFGSLVIGFFLIKFIFSAFGQDSEGFANFFKAFMFWTHTGSTGNGHEKEFFYWVKLLNLYEWVALAGLVLTPLTIIKGSYGIRMVSVTGFGLWLAYSIVSYKTPWCLLSFYWLLVLNAVYWFAVFSEKKGFLNGLLLPVYSVGLLLSAIQAHVVSYVTVDSDHHPYIYGQTYRDLMPPLQEILDRVALEPALKETLRIQVISAYTWPLPFVLGEIKKVGYYSETNTPEILDADYVLVDELLESKYIARIKSPKGFQYHRQVFRARQWASPMVFYHLQPIP